MDNEFTRKEKECPIAGASCNQSHKDCNICIAEEGAWQEEQCRRECEKVDTDSGLSRVGRMGS